MKDSISLNADERNTLLDHLRHAPQPQLRLRAHIILLLADGYAWATIAAVLYCSSRTIDRWQKRFQQGRTDALFDRGRDSPTRLAARWAALVVEWVTHKVPRDFGFLRSRWCCEVLALLLLRLHQVEVSRETVRRWLRQQQIVWRRPRPVLRRQDPERQAILDGLRQLLRHLPEDETVVWEDEVDVNLNPKIGSMWMRRGQQAEVVTPGDNAKGYLAGSLHWRTGKLFTTRGQKRDGALFVAHLHDLRRRLRRYKKIHVICDNAKFHDDCWLVWEFVAKHGDRVVLHFLPKYAPECNPVERVWWVLHEQITRNHQCQTLEALIDLVFRWLEQRETFVIEDSAYTAEQPVEALAKAG
jgi:putative transposase